MTQFKIRRNKRLLYQNVQVKKTKRCKNPFYFQGESWLWKTHDEKRPGN